MSKINNYKSGISILHFEDQYMDMTAIIHEIYLILDQNVKSQDGGAYVTKRLTIDEDGLRVYDLVTVSSNDFPTVRYILSEAEEMSSQLEGFLLERRLFVLDAWRETEDSEKLRCNVNETFQSIEGFYVHIDDVVIFSAYPGNSERIKSRTIPIELTKSSPEQLESFILKAVLEYVN